MANQDDDLTLRVGVIGYGRAGRSIHSRLLHEAGSRVAHVVTTNPARAKDARADWPDVQVHARVTDLLVASPLDVVVIASPTGVHVEQALQCLNAGVPVVVDKPLALDEEGART